MELDDAKIFVRKGVLYGDVYSLVPMEDRALLARWFVYEEPEVPNLRARKAPSVNGETTCRRCGGMLVRTGTCLTCQGCGDSSGSCG